MAALPRILLTTGEPAGIGPDLIIEIAQRAYPAELVVIGDTQMLTERAQQRHLALELKPFQPSEPVTRHRPGTLPYMEQTCAEPVVPGHLAVANARYVVHMLRRAVQQCLAGTFDAMVTAPVHKGIINDAGIAFTGHTELLGELCGARPVMLLTGGELRVALVTTHLPLSKVSKAITRKRLKTVLTVLHHDLQKRFAIANPVILVCGLNPHAGEGGHLGHEEQTVITPVLDQLRQQGMRLQGPLPADTLFTPAHLENADAVLAMYHDQGLPVLKHSSFGRAVNITLGLPVIRTSVDHGTALTLAATDRINVGSFDEAIKSAITLAQSRSVPSSLPTG